MHRTAPVVTFVVVCLGIGHAPRPAAAPIDPITEWSIAASSAASASGMAPLRTPITLALLHLAMYDAVNAIAGNREPYTVNPDVARPASMHAAAVEVGYRVLLAEFPMQESMLAGIYQKLRAAEADSVARRNGARVGIAVARALLKIREGDGRNAAVPYVPGSGPGAWVPTPPAHLAVTTAFLARVRPFTMDSVSQFRTAGPPDLGSRAWAADYNEVKALGAKDSTSRTPVQTATALFWEPLAGTVWIPSIRRIAREQSLDLQSSARFQAAAFAAFADGLIACWDAKFHYNFWRPVTAIQHGDTDGNPATDADPAWLPLAVTPNFPEYMSGHTCATAAVTRAIEDFFPDGVTIPARNIVSGEERFYRHAEDVINEVVEARMLLGLHFRSADEDGAEIGRRIAGQIRRDRFTVRD